MNSATTAKSTAEISALDMLGDLDHAWRLLNEAFERVEPLRPDSIVHSFVYAWRGSIARARGDLATARVMHEATLRVGRYLKHRTATGHGYAMLSAVDLAEGRVDDAFAHLCEALPYHIDLGDGWGLGLDLEGLSAVASLRGRHADAVRLMQGSRFRHTAQFRRWRTDKPPKECTFAQLEVVPPHELSQIFVAGR